MTNKELTNLSVWKVADRSGFSMHVMAATAEHAIEAFMQKGDDDPVIKVERVVASGMLLWPKEVYGE